MGCTGANPASGSAARRFRFAGPGFKIRPSMSTKKFPTLFVPHGAGPCFFMDWNPPGLWRRMEAWLRGIVNLAGAPPAEILIVTGHWEAEAFTAKAHPSPGLLYDYSGFPEHTYRLTWPAPGSPRLAARAREL
jgi:aromatic ring-opening dioxygenase catalytic subunit (LigB family)